jgi:hypothetical protein
VAYAPKLIGHPFANDDSCAVQTITPGCRGRQADHTNFEELAPTSRMRLRNADSKESQVAGHSGNATFLAVEFEELLRACDLRRTGV